MKNQQLLAGLPLASWLYLIAAVVFGARVAKGYSESHTINWMSLTASILLCVAALLSALRARRPMRASRG